jgi:hypothetical protein
MTYVRNSEVGAHAQSLKYHSELYWPMFGLYSANNNKTNLDIWSANLGMCQQIQHFHNSKMSAKDTKCEC